MALILLDLELGGGGCAQRLLGGLGTLHGIDCGANQENRWALGGLPPGSPRDSLGPQGPNMGLKWVPRVLGAQGDT